MKSTSLLQQGLRVASRLPTKVAAASFSTAPVVHLPVQPTVRQVLPTPEAVEFSAVVPSSALEQDFKTLQRTHDLFKHPFFQTVKQLATGKKLDQASFKLIRDFVLAFMKNRPDPLLFQALNALGESGFGLIPKNADEASRGMKGITVGFTGYVLKPVWTRYGFSDDPSLPAYAHIHRVQVLVDQQMELALRTVFRSCKALVSKEIFERDIEPWLNSPSVEDPPQPFVESQDEAAWALKEARTACDRLVSIFDVNCIELERLTGTPA